MNYTPKGELLTAAFLEAFKLNGLLITAGDQLTKEFGLTSARWKVLGALSLSGSAMTVPDIARTMGQTRQAVQRLVNEMIKDDLLETLDNPNHQRAKLLNLTAKGQDCYEHVMAKQIPWVNNMAQKHQEENLKALLCTLKSINSDLNQT